MGATARAEFLGLSGELIGLGTGRVVANVYAQFDDVNDRVLAVGDATIFTNVPGGFYQSSANPFFRPGTQHVMTSQDSFVCIDTAPGSFTTVAGSIEGNAQFFNYSDAQGATNFSIIQGSGSGAGWSTTTPTGATGLADQGKVVLAHLVVGPDNVTECSGLWWSSTVTYFRASTSQIETATVARQFVLVYALPVCGHSTCQQCCLPNPYPVPTCSDAACCAVVCPLRPECCTTWWDVPCAQLAAELCSDCPALCVADITSDGSVDGADLGELLSGWNLPGPTDINGDLTTNAADLGAMLAAWGRCP
jgi:hypothetical protein